MFVLLMSNEKSVVYADTEQSRLYLSTGEGMYCITKNSSDKKNPGIYVLRQDIPKKILKKAKTAMMEISDPNTITLDDEETGIRFQLQEKFMTELERLTPIKTDKLKKGDYRIMRRLMAVVNGVEIYADAYDPFVSETCLLLLQNDGLLSKITSPSYEWENEDYEFMVYKRNVSPDIYERNIKIMDEICGTSRKRIIKERDWVKYTLKPEYREFIEKLGDDELMMSRINEIIGY